MYSRKQPQDNRAKLKADKFEQNWAELLNSEIPDQMYGAA